MKTTQKELELMAFVLSIVNKTINFSKSNFKELLNIYSNSENRFIDNTEGANLISIFLANYEFKSYNDFVSILNMMKEQGFFDDSVTFYSHYNKEITQKLFESKSIKAQWIIDHMTTKGSFAEINNVVRFIFNTDQGDKIGMLKQIINYVSGMKKSVIIYEAIIRFGIAKPYEGMVGVFETIFEICPEIEILTLQNSFDAISDEKIKRLIGLHLYKQTNNPRFLPIEAQDIFVF